MMSCVGRAWEGKDGAWRHECELSVAVAAVVGTAPRLPSLSAAGRTASNTGEAEVYQVVPGTACGANSVPAHPVWRCCDPCLLRAPVRGPGWALRELGRWSVFCAGGEEQPGGRRRGKRPPGRWGGECRAC